MSQALQIFLGIASTGFFISLFRRTFFIGRPGVQPDWFGRLDVSLALILSALFSFLALRLFNSTTAAVPFTESDIGYSIFAQLVFGGAILAYIILRQIPLRDFFGLEQPVWRSIGAGALLMGGILPGIMILANVLNPHGGDEQEAVKFFRETDSVQGRCLLAFMAVIIAPTVEEIVFRGLLYRVFKGTFGKIAAMFFTSVLFACIHGNISTLLPLTLLAFGLTMGLELTGSLLVSIAMHATFNGVSLLLLLGESAR